MGTHVRPDSDPLKKLIFIFLFIRYFTALLLFFNFLNYDLLYFIVSLLLRAVACGCKRAEQQGRSEGECEKIPPSETKKIVENRLTFPKMKGAHSRTRTRHLWQIGKLAIN